MEEKIKVFRVYSNFGNTEYAFCKTEKEAKEKIEKAINRIIKEGSVLSPESIRDSFSYDFSMETKDNADYLLNF